MIIETLGIPLGKTENTGRGCTKKNPKIAALINKNSY